MPSQARKVDLDNPDRALVCVDLNGVLDSYTGWKHARRNQQVDGTVASRTPFCRLCSSDHAGERRSGITGALVVSTDKHLSSPAIQPACPIVV